MRAAAPIWTLSVSLLLLPVYQVRTQPSLKQIPVFFHVLLDEAGTEGWVEESVLAEQIDRLNEAFRLSRFSFWLAGVHYRPHAVWFDSLTVNPLDPRRTAMFKALALAPAHVINIYTARLPKDSFHGLSSFPASAPEASPRHGILLDYRVLPGMPGKPNQPVSNEGDWLIHEMGHYFGLLHTFAAGPWVCAEIHKGDPPSCASSGDGICETAPHLQPFGSDRTSCTQFSCEAVGDSLAFTAAPNDNFMNYTSDVCRSAFVLDQHTRMRAQAEAFRGTLLQETGMIPLSSDYLVQAGERLLLRNGIKLTFPVQGRLRVSGTLDIQHAHLAAQTDTWAGIYLGPGSKATLDATTLVHVAPTQAAAVLLHDGIATLSETHFSGVQPPVAAASVGASARLHLAHQSFGAFHTSPVVTTGGGVLSLEHSTFSGATEAVIVGLGATLTTGGEATRDTTGLNTWQGNAVGITARAGSLVLLAASADGGPASRLFDNTLDLRAEEQARAALGGNWWGADLVPTVAQHPTACLSVPTVLAEDPARVRAPAVLPLAATCTLPATAPDTSLAAYADVRRFFAALATAEFQAATDALARLASTATLHPTEVALWTTVFEVETGQGLPVSTALRPPAIAPPTLHLFPNPARRSLTLRYTLAAHTAGRIHIFDVLGRQQVSLTLPQRSATGLQEYQLALNALPPGVYFVRLETPTSSTTRRFLRLP